MTDNFHKHLLTPPPGFDDETLKRLFLEMLRAVRIPSAYLSDEPVMAVDDWSLGFGSDGYVHILRNGLALCGMVDQPTPLRRGLDCPLCDAIKRDSDGK